jgi:hypothetical protein
MSDTDKQNEAGIGNEFWQVDLVDLMHGIHNLW